MSRYRRVEGNEKNLPSSSHYGVTICLRSSVFGFRGLMLAGNEPKICPVALILRSQFGFGFRSSVFGFRVFVFLSAQKLLIRFLGGLSRFGFRSSVFGFRLRGGPPDIVFSVFGFRLRFSVFAQLPGPSPDHLSKVARREPK